MAARMSVPAAAPIRVGVVANPVSARDVRRISSHAAGLTLAERANMLVRLLHVLGAFEVPEVLMMPEREGLRALLMRQLDWLGQREPSVPLPRLHWLNMPVMGTIEDSGEATRRMVAEGVKAIVVLGGDGTHRVVARDIGQTPMVAVSSGTNNAFPPMREITVTALAAGLFAQGRLPAARVLQSNKLLHVRKLDQAGRCLAEDVALVDVGIFNEQILGARAISDVSSLRTVVVTQASPEAVGLSGVAAMLAPLARTEPGALVVELKPEIGPHAETDTGIWQLRAALAPGLIERLQVLSWQRVHGAEVYRLHGQAGLISLDGEREMSFQAGDEVVISLEEDAFRTLDVPTCLRIAAEAQVLLARVGR